MKLHLRDSLKPGYAHCGHPEREGQAEVAMKEIRITRAEVDSAPGDILPVAVLRALLERKGVPLAPIQWPAPTPAGEPPVEVDPSELLRPMPAVDVETEMDVATGDLVVRWEAR
jgi:hypothetical protein